MANSDAQMIVPYQWILNIVEEEPKTIASKMILFRGERVFRVGLKNLAQSPILLFMAADLNRIGMRVEDVMYGVEDADTCPAKMTKMNREDQLGVDGSLQLFTVKLDKMVTGQRTFVFRICIKGNVPEYSYRLSDRLGKDQLWAAKENPNFADVEFIVKGKKLLANKSILAARSPVFAAEFTNEQPVREGRYQINIDGVEPSTVEQFLHFIYTGEPISPLANEQLLKLAVQYQLTTLISLCQVALKKIETIQMMDLMFCLNMKAEIPPTSQIKPEKENEIFFDGTTPTFRCDFQFFGYELRAGKSKCLTRYQNQDIFVAHITGSDYRNTITYGINICYARPVIHLSCAKHRSFGLKIEDIYCGMRGHFHLLKMEAKELKKNAEVLLLFTVKWGFDITADDNTKLFNFDIKTVCTIGNYYYEMMDDKWLKDLWAAATDQKLTDVEIFVGTVKVMEAHRIILSSRSPVLNILLNKVSSATKSIVTFGVEFDVDTVKQFLQFLYTGSLEISAGECINYKQLLELATMYEVETLKNFCQVSNAVPPDVEDLTSTLLEL